MKDDQSKQAHRFLEGKSQNLGPLFAKAKELQALNQKIAAYLSPEIAHYCQVANQMGNKLTLIVANGSIATQLRFQAIDIIRKFHSSADPALQKIQTIQCKVYPDIAMTPLQTRSRAKRKVQPLSPETAQIIHDMAESIQDPKLKEIMERIARRGK